MKKLIDTAQEAPNTVLLAGDEASLYLQATLKVVWKATRHAVSHNHRHAKLDYSPMLLSIISL